MPQETNKKDQYGLFSTFPSFVYRGKLQTHEKWKAMIVPILERRYAAEKGSNSYKDNSPACWNCDCYTSFFDETMIDHTKETEIPVNELLGDISGIIQECIKAADFYPHAFLVHQQWFNAYGPGQNQEAHNHIPSHISGIYYIQFDPEKHKGTTFLNSQREYFEAPRFAKQNYEPDMCNYGCYKEQMTLVVDEGDVVLFPAQMEHMVHKQPGIEKNPDGTLRISFSFNIELVSEQEMRQRMGDQTAETGMPEKNNIPIMNAGGAPVQEPEAKEEWSSDWF